MILLISCSKAGSFYRLFIKQVHSQGVWTIVLTIFNESTTNERMQRCIWTEL